MYRGSGAIKYTVRVIVKALVHRIITFNKTKLLSLSVLDMIVVTFEAIEASFTVRSLILHVHVY